MAEVYTLRGMDGENEQSDTALQISLKNEMGKTHLKKRVFPKALMPNQRCMATVTTSP